MRRGRSAIRSAMRPHACVRTTRALTLCERRETPRGGAGGAGGRGPPGAPRGAAGGLGGAGAEGAVAGGVGEEKRDGDRVVVDVEGCVVLAEVAEVPPDEDHERSHLRADAAE